MNLPGQNDWQAWLDLVVADNDGKPQRVMSIGVDLKLENGEHVPQGLVLNGLREAWATTKTGKSNQSSQRA